MSYATTLPKDCSAPTCRVRLFGEIVVLPHAKDAPINKNVPVCVYLDRMGIKFVWSFVFGLATTLLCVTWSQAWTSIRQLYAALDDGLNTCTDSLCYNHLWRSLGL
jgi:hypothetical protein